MSTSSGGSGGVHRRLDSLQRRQRLSRTTSSAARTFVSRYDAYTFALRVAYLSHLLQPKARRLQHVAGPKRPQSQVKSSHATDLLKDFQLVKDNKSTRFPKEFMKEFDKRIEGVLIGKEKSPEYADSLVKRTFAVFLNEFKKPEFRKGVEKDRRVEDLLLIFYSNATKELSKGQQPGNDQWKLMVDRHVALFVRLISITLRSNGWDEKAPELTSRLKTLESKLLIHDQDLSEHHASDGGTTQEVEVPRSQQAKDMTLVKVVAELFDKPVSQVQQDIDDQRDLWTERAALQDLKMYHTHLSLNSTKTLRSEDFDTEEAFEAWRKSELPDLSQMISAIVQSNLELAKTVSGYMPQLKPVNSNHSDPSFSDKRMSNGEVSNSYVIDQPVDVSSLSLNGNGHHGVEVDNEPYMFIPAHPRSFYREIVKTALLHDIRESPSSEEDQSIRLLSKQTTDLLSEIGLRWRLPYVSRMILFLDVAQELFADRQIDIDTLDAAFNYVKEPHPDKKRPDMAQLFDRTKWTMADYTMNQQILKSVDNVLLRDLFDEMLRCYESKPPNIGPIMTVLETQIYDDPLYSRGMDNLDQFAESLQGALKEKAMEHYDALYAKEVSNSSTPPEFYHVIQCGKAVMKLCEKIQKRYRKTPAIMGVEPFRILIELVLPRFEADARGLIASIVEETKGTPNEVPIQDGFELYREMVEVRNFHLQNLPSIQFYFEIEGLLSSFVWRCIAGIDESIVQWVEEAVKADNFLVRAEPNQAPTDEDKHSLSAVDVFRSFNQSIDQIMSLNWDDDLTYAKFLTALSKAVGAGVRRYCDLLEQQIVREMDRLTPAQEQALTKTKQERWLQIAKDTITNKEKVEPFHFLPESFVKLNNIEYCMLQLDKIEKEMNVDACVDVIQRYEPSLQGSQRKRRNEKFVFTIKIIEAEDLKACDPNGLSDPYVVLGDEFQKRLAKTRIIYANLNPRWDETVDIPSSGLLSVTATIWDWDILGDHDCVGRTTIKLDPSHFSDYMPREYWLDLDTQGRLLVRITMEGEKDDIQFYFGKAFRSLKRTERDMARKITDKLSAYINQCISRRALRALTKSQTLSMSTVSSYFSRATSGNAVPTTNTVRPSQADITAALKPLFTYLNDNFAIMQETLTSSSMITVMTRVWKEVLSVAESLLVPPLSDKPSSQSPLNEAELDVVFKWLQLLFDFFHAVDEETGQANGVPLDVLKSPKYHDLQNLNFFYNETTENLIRTSEGMAAATIKAANQLNKAQGGPGFRPQPSIAGTPHKLNPAVPSTTRRAKTIMQSRNLGTMKKAKREKRSAAQAEPSDDMILRILRMRPEAHRYLRDRAKQKERLAAQQAAEYIVQQSLLQGAGARGAPRPGAGMQRRGA